VSQRIRMLATLLLALAFAVGGLAGMVLEEALGLDWFEFLDEDDDDTEDRLLVGLDLDRGQRARAEAILEREEDRLEDYWERRIPEIQEILRASYADIRALLSPAQQQLFDRRVRELGGRLPAEVRN
jgi:hypothetical protein